MYHEALKTGTKLFATAPMIDWSDRHYRFFARQLTKNAILYTEMIVADAILRGNRDRLLGYDALEHPLALQLGGNDPAKLAEAARIGAEFGYDEINLNVGCPSDRVQEGRFGACLMAEPDLVAQAVAAMRARGVDDDAFTARLATGLRARPGVAAAWSPRELAALPPGHELAGLWRRQLPPDLQWAAVATPREGWLWSEGGGSADHGTPALLDRAVPVVFWGVGVPARRCDAVVRTVDIAPTLAALLRVAPTEPLDGTAVPLDRCGRPGRRIAHRAPPDGAAPGAGAADAG